MATTITANGINFPDGSASAPSIGGTDTNTGLFTGSDLVGFATGGVERIRIDANGKVCINNDTALSDLHICTAGSSEQDGTLRIGGTNSELGLVLDYDQASATVSRITANPTYNNDDSLLKICVDGDANPNQLVLRGDGNIGIGINDTSADLQIVGSNSAGLLRVGGNQTNNVGLDISYDNSSTTTTTFKQNYRATNAGALIKFDSGYFTFHTGTAGGESLRIDSSGKVGIGTTNPNAQLHILKSLQANLVIGSSSAGGAYLILDGDSNGDSSGGDYAYIGHTTAGDLIVAADNPAGTGSVFLKSNGASYQAVGCYASGSVELRYQNGTRFQTTSTGAILTSGAAGTTSCRFGNTANRGLEVKVLNHGNNDAGAVLNAADSENSGYAAYIAFQTGGEEKARFEGQYDNFRLSNTCIGITFNGDYAAANALNDYEEGSFTPQPWSAAGSISYSHAGSARQGRYTKIGNLVYFVIRLQLSSVSTANGQAFIIGLPFQASNRTGSVDSCHAFNINFYEGIGGLGSDTSITGRVASGQSYVILQKHGDGSSASAYSANDWSGNWSIYGSGCYHTDS